MFSKPTSILQKNKKQNARIQQVTSYLWRMWYFARAGYKSGNTVLLSMTRPSIILQLLKFLNQVWQSFLELDLVDVKIHNFKEINKEIG